MRIKSFALPPLAFAALALSAGACQAALTVFNSQAGFLAAVSAPGVDSYTDISVTGSTASPLNRVAGAYTYSASAGASTFFGAGTTVNPWLSTNSPDDVIAFSAFTGGVRAIGGNFFGSDINGGFFSGSLTLTATDSLGATSIQSIVNATSGSFLGFLSTGAMTSLVVSAVQPAGSSVWPTVDNLTLALAAVPEPETYVMMLIGVGMLGYRLRRRYDL